MRNLPTMSILHFPAWPRPHCGAAALTILSGLTDNVRDAADEPPGNKPARAKSTAAVMIYAVRMIAHR